MPALDTSQVDQGSELAARWQQLAQEWAKWWMTSALPQSAPPHHTSANSAQRVTPLFDSRAIAELTERFAPRFQALWTRVMSGSATLPLAALVTGSVLLLTVAIIAAARRRRPAIDRTVVPAEPKELTPVG